MQACHGKGAPLKRIHAGDGIVYYAPTVSFRGKDRLQSFVSIGFTRDESIYPFDMGNGFVPFRRDVDYLPAHEASILPLLDRLEFTRGKRNWGYVFRFGLVEISAHDFRIIAAAMEADTDGGQAPVEKPVGAQAELPV